MSSKRRSRKSKKQVERGAKCILNSNFGMCEIFPSTKNQEKVFEFYDSGKNIVLHGSAGTGKTFLSLYLALKDVFEGGEYNKVVIVRSAVQTRDQGFMPGNGQEKEAYYEAPYVGLVNELFGRGDAHEILKKKKIVSFTTTSFIRGLTYDNAIVIVDECQSMSAHELDTVITRVGKNSKILFCGDTAQDDLIKSKHDKSGLSVFMRILEDVPSFERVNFTCDDIVRSGLVKDYIKAKEKAGVVI